MDMFNEEELDFTKLKYVLYARKSTDDPQRQVRSIDDQIAECKQLATRLGLHIIGEPLIEKKSAKIPNKRPIFRQMLNDLRKGTYDGIIAWNPDRLARNMKEGGEVIDMVDGDIIKDLKFVTHHFSKDANGKMLLGMAFVLSKQYSDNLSQNVTRGVRKNFLEGKSPVFKPGYFRSDEGLYKPDGKNFEIVLQAWELRKEGISLEEITEYMNKHGYERITKAGRIITMTKQTLTDVFKDPFYYGILIHQKTGQKVDLREAYAFQPAISEDTYNQVQQLSYRRLKPNKPYKRAFYPLKAMLLCSFCESNMYVAPSTGNTRRYLNARCDNKACKRKKKSIRMKNVFDFIYSLLEKGLNFTEKEYNDYYNNLTKTTDSKREKLSIEIHSKQGVLKSIKREIKERSLGIIKVKKGSEIWKANEKQINDLVDQQEELEGAIEELGKHITKPEEDRLSVEEFLNLSKNAAMVVKSANAVVKDQICRIIFLNFIVDEEKVLSYQAKEPFDTMLKTRKSTSSRGKRT